MNERCVRSRAREGMRSELQLSRFRTHGEEYFDFQPSAPPASGRTFGQAARSTPTFDLRLLPLSNERRGVLRASAPPAFEQAACSSWQARYALSSAFEQAARGSWQARYALSSEAQPRFLLSATTRYPDRGRRRYVGPTSPCPHASRHRRVPPYWALAADFAVTALSLT